MTAVNTEAEAPALDSNTPEPVAIEPNGSHTGDNEDPRAKYRISFDWDTYPAELRNKIFKTEQNAYINRLRKIRHADKLRNIRERNTKLLTAYFMLFTAYRKHNRPWSLFRRFAEQFMRKTGETNICYLYFCKFYRDNPKHFEVFYEDFCEKFSCRFRIVNYNGVAPALRQKLNI